ncbi:MAG: Na+-transporting NADH:ubiquinone oxidoreductase subunit A [Kiritimatiellia bacterium]|jgi:Na+-transporting NADH:ubiquinone oxidoreductase subunit A
MPNHVIRRGLDIPIAGAATGTAVELAVPSQVSIDPREFRGVVPRLAARAGDVVQQGSPLFYSKSHPEMKYLASGGGTVAEVRRGSRRVITDVVVNVDADSQACTFKQWSSSDLGTIQRADAQAQLLAGGLWFGLRERPLSRVANPDDTPQSILICGTETGPAQPSPSDLLAADANASIQAGVQVLASLCGGKIFLTQLDGASNGAFQGLTGVEVHTFKGKHPAGDATVQINYIDPPRGQHKVWYIDVVDVARIGRLFLEGRYPGDKVYAAVGTGVASPRLVRTLVGAPVKDIVGDVRGDNLRWISGSVLTGERIDENKFGGWYTSAVHVLPDEIPRRLFGWMMPSFGMWSAHRAFLSGFLGAGKPKDLRPGIQGGLRGLVPVNAYRRVVATPDIEPDFLMKALSAGDLEESISLGMLDMSEEEAALCTYVCPSKIEFDVLLRQGLELYEKEI